MPIHRFQGSLNQLSLRSKCSQLIHFFDSRDLSQIIFRSRYVQSCVHPLGINVTISEMQYSYSVQSDATSVFVTEDMVHACKFSVASY
jgi:hypothetical protein